MKHLIITSLMAFSSTFAFAEADCDFLNDNVFVCDFNGTSGLEIFENLTESQILNKTTGEDGSALTEILAPKLIGFDLDIKNCISEAFENEATATCFLNEIEEYGFSTSGPISEAYSTARVTPQNTVIRRIDVR